MNHGQLRLSPDYVIFVAYEQDACDLKFDSWNTLEIMQAILTLLLLLSIVSYSHMLLTAAIAKIAGVGILEIQLGFSPIVFRVGKMKLGLFPIGGHVKFVGAEESPTPAPPHLNYSLKPLRIKLLIAVIPWCVMTGFAILILGREAWQGMIVAVPQWFQGAIFPFSTAQEYLSSAAAHFKSVSWASALAIVTAKFAAFSLIPSSGSTGGLILFFSLEKMHRMTGATEKEAEEKAMKVVAVPFIIQLLAWMVWLMAVSIWLVRNF